MTMEEMTKEQAYKLVNDTAIKVHNTIVGAMAEAPDKIRWLLVGRVVNVVFAKFYSPIMNESRIKLEGEAIAKEIDL